MTKLEAQDKQIAEINKAENKYQKDKDINALILFWENLWDNGGLLFKGSRWTFRLPDLYMEQKRYDDIPRILDLIDPFYQERKEAYIKKIKSAKAKGGT